MSRHFQNPSLVDFGAALFQPDDLVELRFLPEPVRRRWIDASMLPNFHFTPACKNVHFGPNPRRRRGGKAADVLLARCLFVDIERIGADDAAQRIAHACVPEPTAVVVSGGGVHAYWRLVEPMVDLDAWRLRQKALIAAVGSDPSVHDAPRVMRLPGTLNHKYCPPRECEVFECQPELRYPIEEFPEFEEAAPPTPATPLAANSHAVPTRIVSNWSGSTADLERRAAAYLDSMPPAISGSGGHNATYAAATALVHGFALDFGVAFALLRDRFNPRCQPPWTDKELLHKVSDAVTKPHSLPYGWLRDADRVTTHDGPPVDLSLMLNGVGSVVNTAAPTSMREPAIDTGAPSTPSGRKLRVRCLADVEPTAIRWLWPGRIALGKLTLLAGNPGLGKSFLTCDLAARVSAGRCWPDVGDPCPAGHVLILNCEDDPSDTIRPRLDAAGADVSRIHFIDGVDGFTRGEIDPFDLGDHAHVLREHLRQTPDVRLVIIDPVSAYIGEKNDHKNGDVRGLLRPLSEMAHETGAAFLIVTHMNKSQGDSIARVLGSIGWTAAARAAWAVVRDPDNAARRLLLNIKNNVGSEALGMAFRLDASACGGDGVGDLSGLSAVPRIAWEEAPLTIRADDILGAPRSVGADDPAPARSEAVDFLRQVLESGPVPTEQIKVEAKAAGVKWATLRKAKASLDVRSRKTGFGKDAVWNWVMPEWMPPPGSGEALDTAPGAESEPSAHTSPTDTTAPAAPTVPTAEGAPDEPPPEG